MLKYRVVQTILYNSRMMVEKPKLFERPGRSIGTITQYLQNITSRNIDELVLIDIDAANENRSLKFEKIKQFPAMFCPLTLGGNIKSLADIEFALKSGADKVCINSALTDNDFIRKASLAFGSQAIVASVDVSIHTKHIASDIYKYVCYVGRKPIDTNYLDFIHGLVELGVGEILLTAMHRDGTRSGYDKRLIKEVCREVNIPVIANGGAESFSDMADALRAGAHAIAASSMFLFTALTPRTCSQFLDNHGFPCRIES